MSQEQHAIVVHFLDGTTASGTRTGNNAAWKCKCERVAPLVGYSDLLDSERESSKVICPDCERAFRVVGPALRKAPTEVREV